MVYHIVLFKLKEDIPPTVLDDMMMQTRTQLLKIPEVLSLKCGKHIDPASEWHFFLAIDFDSMEKLAVYRVHPVHIKYVENVIKPLTLDHKIVDFEMEPHKNVKYS